MHVLPYMELVQGPYGLRDLIMTLCLQISEVQQCGVGHYWDPAVGSEVRTLCTARQPRALEIVVQKPISSFGHGSQHRSEGITEGTLCAV